MYVKQITPINWILTSSLTGKKLGLAVKKEQGLSILTEPNRYFKDFSELASYYSEEFKQEAETIIEQDQNTINNIHGYPIKHDQAFEINVDEDSSLITYRAREGSKKVYVAGYFGVRFKSGYVGSYCPKIETLLESDFIGPYKSKFELQFQITKYNREKDK